MLEFSSSLKDLNKKNNNALLQLIKEYFELYKEPYPYFLITVEARPIEKIKTKEAEDMTYIMGKLRLLGRSSFNKTHKLIAPLFDEIAGRFDITSKELKFLTPIEIISLLKGNNLDIDNLIKSRQNCFFTHIDGISVLNENCFLTIPEDIEIKSELKGQGTFAAHYKGEVKKIENVQDINNLKGGEVIVLKMTTTDLITENLKKVGAIITDEGGITCHAAIISREFKIPALIGTKVATKMFKDGDLVEIDAKKGIAVRLE